MVLDRFLVFYDSRLLPAHFPATFEIRSTTDISMRYNLLIYCAITFVGATRAESLKKMLPIIYQQFT
jgi:hypothetical protein